MDYILTEKGENILLRWRDTGSLWESGFTGNARDLNVLEVVSKYGDQDEITRNSKNYRGRRYLPKKVFTSLDFLRWAGYIKFGYE